VYLFLAPIESKVIFATRNKAIANKICHLNSLRNNIIPQIINKRTPHPNAHPVLDILLNLLKYI
tara:strand:+ start:1925 stop:2116 length:192 start_codon:yes stop_codon:yes gene_type:complete